jgi:hypothetical protein
MNSLPKQNIDETMANTKSCQMRGGDRKPKHRYTKKSRKNKTQRAKTHRRK